MSDEALQGITEDDIANYLAANPGFFERHAALLAAIQFPHPQGARTVSLQERQAMMLRERIKGLERRIIEMIRNGQENIGHFEKLQAWTLQQMRQPDPQALHEQLREAFQIPATALRLFGAPGEADWAKPVSERLRQHAQAMSEPYCGANDGSEATHWVELPVASMALVPLRRADGQVFGLLLLASSDATRYSADKGLEFLLRVGEVASAALAGFAPLPD
ncbi:DUF484 family protein [Inhella sp.]|uniref:DUF484 family protein n=1 Tax=Inhella sp. TaxID=1921806 RepID=UPI0035AED02D